ncbi:Unknown protein [Striga hermonthica]|uniref:Reverse transcriptase domain-containing protein n=1 Tax=Striga hermonthica TaxID=68872 RepID=A0A9N7NNL9_STRHE|nr:Unknown protein [Striga hermonthica]
MERLALMISRYVNEGRWKPISLGRGRVKIPYLLFADDLLLFTEATSDQVECVTDVLRVFCQDSGLKISASKTKVFFSKNILTDEAQAIASYMNFERVDNLGKYLGMPVIHGKVTHETYSNVLHKAETREDNFTFPRGSTVIRAIARVWKKVVEGTRWSIRNGTRARFWKDRWLPGSNILSYIAICPIPGEQLDWTIDKLVNGARGWRWDLFQELLPATTCLRISAVSPPSSGLGDDLMYWGWSSDGHFSTRSAYAALTGENTSSDRHLWKDIWSWTGPQRIRQFLWLTIKNRLLTNEDRHRRHLAACAACEVCGAAQETCLHSLRDCTHAKRTWRHLIPHHQQAAFFSHDLNEWVRQNLRNELHIQVDNWSCVFGVTLWQLWRDRNAFIFDKKKLNIQRRLAVIGGLVEGINSASLTTKKFGALFRRLRHQANPIVDCHHLSSCHRCRSTRNSDKTVAASVPF